MKGKEKRKGKDKEKEGTVLKKHDKGEGKMRNEKRRKKGNEIRRIKK
jgi:hypothetical protein